MALGDAEDVEAEGDGADGEGVGLEGDGLGLEGVGLEVNEGDTEYVGEGGTTALTGGMEGLWVTPAGLDAGKWPTGPENGVRDALGMWPGFGLTREGAWTVTTGTEVSGTRGEVGTTSSELVYCGCSRSCSDTGSPPRHPDCTITYVAALTTTRTAVAAASR